jgi:ABC-type taurine transport system ATPase subunit
VLGLAACGSDARGDIDGAYVWNPNLAKLIKDGGHVLVSSAGKTTLLSLLAGFLTPSTGEILVGGAPVRAPTALRADPAFVAFRQRVRAAIRE